MNGVHAGGGTHGGRMEAAAGQPIVEEKRCNNNKEQQQTATSGIDAKEYLIGLYGEGRATLLRRRKGVYSWPN